MGRCATLAALVAVLFVSPAPAGEISNLERRVAKAAGGVRASVVVVFARKKGQWDLTGVVVGARNTILTLRGPLLDAQGTMDGVVSVRFGDDNKTVSAQVIAEDKETGTVLLKAKRKGKPIDVRDTAALRLGTPAILTGYSFGAGKESEPTVSVGYVSGLDRTRTGLRAFHLSALVNPGAFGAPVVDFDGRLLGIVAQGVTAAAGQTVVVPFETIHANYVKQGGAAAKAIGGKIYPRSARPRLAENLGIVLDDVARRTRHALVGVRALEPLVPPVREKPAAKAQEKPDAKPEQEPREKPGKKPGKKPKPPPGKKPQNKPQRPRPPMPRVPGKRAGHDRSSGVVIGVDGWILCPLRVTGWPGPLRTLRVDLPDGTDRAAKLVGYDERLRIALIRAKTKGLRPLTEAPDESIRAGRFAIALGFPHADPEALAPRLTFGIVSRAGALRQIHPALRAIQTDAKVGGGNRGGPLVDLEGRLLGVILDVNDTERTGYHSRRRGRYVGNAGLGFALPLAAVRPVLDKLKAGARLEGAYLGVRSIPVTGGLQIVEVLPDTAAAAAKLAVGDLIVSLDGRKVETTQELIEALALKTAGDAVKMKVVRGTQTLDVDVTLRARPS